MGEDNEKGKWPMTLTWHVISLCLDLALQPTKKKKVEIDLSLFFMEVKGRSGIGLEVANHPLQYSL